MAMCVQEEGRLLLETGESVFMATQGNKTYQANRKWKGKAPLDPKPDIKKESKCHFCRKKGHIKNDCIKYQKWIEKKARGGLILLLQAIFERSIYSGNKMQSRVEAIGTCTLVLSSGFILELEKTFYISNFCRNLISVSRLMPLGYSFFLEGYSNLFYKSKLVGNGTLFEGLFSLNLQNDSTPIVMHVQAGTKCCVMNEDSSILWHRRLGHISIDRIKRLVNDGVLSTLDFTDFDTCVNCIKGKQTNKSKKGAKRSSTILEIINSDICCPNMDAYGQKYFITFIDAYLRYMYLYMLHNKSEVLEAFKVFKAEVEKQCGKQIKIVRTDRGGEYYGRYTEHGQAQGPFAKFLQENGIFAQHTMPGSPDQNGVAERRNRTLLDMVHSMLSSSKLPKSLWIDALKTTVSKGYRFYCPSNNTRIVESRNAKFLENDLISGSDHFQNTNSVRDQPSTSRERLVIIYNTPQVQPGVEQIINEIPQAAENIPADQVVQEIPKIIEQHIPQENVDTTLRRSTRERKSAIPSDYVVYLQESNIGVENDPESFSQAMSCKESEFWYNAMKEEINSMKSNEVWDLVKLPNGVKAIGCKESLKISSRDKRLHAYVQTIR
ncbi:uncharacterized protein LOC132047552 [Lycium ferocissimum]|uniref:uncharacterized protein LOC132047552 n=1 Tax=Lycium ferocissimum TaxID=112874 RepID=UPI002815B2A4|nr:uncharacterized protein LOC132047552 [Lycium ferocissimum]